MTASSASKARLLRAASTAEVSTKYKVRHKCFLSYHGTDADEVSAFVEEYGPAFIPRVIGVNEDDPFIDSDDDDYVIGQIQQKYMWDSTATIVLIGDCTWARRFVDWEIYSSLRHDSNNKLNGLLAVQLPSVDGETPSLPSRLVANLPKEGGEAYARYCRYPNSEYSLRGWIQDVFDARSTRRDLIAPAAKRRLRNSACN